MAGTLGDMKSRIASEVARADLTTQIASAITDAIGTYQKVRFRFNEAIPDNARSFATVAAQWIYTHADQADIDTLLAIDYLLIQVGNTIFQLRREDPVRIRTYNQVNTMMGQPSWFAYEGNELILSAIPDQAYTIYLGGYFVAPAPATDVEANNPWMVYAEQLIRAMAKYLIATHVTRNPTMAQKMSPVPTEQNGGVVGEAYRQERILVGEGNRVVGRGLIRAMPF